MDNGQAGQNLVNTGIFSPNQNPDGAQIDQSIAAVESAINGNNQNTWAPERDNRGIGNKAILSNETTPTPNAEVAPTRPGAEGNLGEITDLNPPTPPIQPTPQPNQADPVAVATFVFDESLIRPDGDHISKETINQIKHAEKDLEGDGNISKFNDEIYEMKKKYLKNAFGRELT